MGKGFWEKRIDGGEGNRASTENRRRSWRGVGM
jgi:hypothetical protein